MDNPGRIKLSVSISDLDNAIGIFEKRFRKHTGVDWKIRNNLHKYTGNYIISPESIKTSKTETDEDPYHKAEQILKDVNFEINQNNSTDQDLIKTSSVQLSNLFPRIFKKQIHLDSNESIKKVKETLFEYKKKQQEIEE